MADSRPYCDPADNLSWDSLTISYGELLQVLTKELGWSKTPILFRVSDDHINRAHKEAIMYLVPLRLISFITMFLNMRLMFGFTHLGGVWIENGTDILYIHETSDAKVCVSTSMDGLYVDHDFTVLYIKMMLVIGFVCIFAAF